MSRRPCAGLLRLLSVGPVCPRHARVSCYALLRRVDSCCVLCPRPRSSRLLTARSPPRECRVTAPHFPPRSSSLLTPEGRKLSTMRAKLVTKAEDGPCSLRDALARQARERGATRGLRALSAALSLLIARVAGVSLHGGVGRSKGDSKPMRTAECHSPGQQDKHRDTRGWRRRSDTHACARRRMRRLELIFEIGILEHNPSWIQSAKLLASSSHSARVSWLTVHPRATREIPIVHGI